MEFGFGSGILTGQRTDIVSYTPQRFGALQDVSVEFQGDIKQLYSTFQYPIDNARGKTKIMGKAKLAQISAYTYNNLFFGQTVSTGQLKYSYNESTTTGTGAASYTVANSGSTPLNDQGVFYVSNGNQFQGVSSAPGSGQYTWNPSTGVYGFSTFDASTGVYVNYTYTVTTGYNIAITNQAMGQTPRFKCTLFQQYEGYSVVLVLNQCVSTRLTFPTRIDDYVIVDMDFEAYADAGGNVGSWNSGT